MVLVPAGSFLMGSSDQTDATPAHQVWIDSFLIDRREVTQAQFEKLGFINTAHFKGAAHPMEQVSWPEAARFCNQRSIAEGLQPCYDIETAACKFQANGYRLPTEAEWEYACRAGSTQAFFFGNDIRPLTQYAWFAANSIHQTHPVGQKRPNPWGLFDITGNVAEWCNDRFDPDYYKSSPTNNPPGPAQGAKYCLRGGAWNSTEDQCRSDKRQGENPGFHDACFGRDFIGFRCVRKPFPNMTGTTE